MLRLSQALAVSLIPLGLACDVDLGTPRGPLRPDAGPLVSWDDVGRPPAAPSDDGVPTVAIDRAEPDGARRLVVSGRASDDRAVVAVRLTVGLSGPVAVPDPGDGFASWTLTVAVPGGSLTLLAEAFDAGGRRGVAEHGVELPVAADVEPPSVVFTAPEEGHRTSARRVVLRGEASDSHGVLRVDLSGEASGPLGAARTGDGFYRWGLEVPLPPGGPEVFVARALDAAGNAAEARLRVVSRAAPDGSGPEITVLEPEDGAVVDRPRPALRVRVAAAAGVETVAARVGEGPWRPLAEDGEAWALPLRLSPGDNDVRVVARDLAGRAARRRLAVTLDDGWPDGPHLSLRPPRPAGEAVTAEVDRAGAAELFPPAIREELVLMSLDPRPMIRDTLARIMAACGPGWTDPDFEPSCPPEWGRPEANLWGLLTMTPRRTDPTGTRMEAVRAFTDDSHERELLPVGFGEMLAEALQVDPDLPVLTTEVMSEALAVQLVGSHPEAAADGSLRVTLEDGLLDMATLAERYGPSGEHPGFLQGELSADVMAPDFGMRFVMESNLRFWEGIDLARGRKAWFADHPAELPVVSFDFEDPAGFSVQGLVERPRADMTFAVAVAPRLVAGGETPEPRPRGGGEAWDLPPWTLERVVAEAGFLGFSGLRSGCDLCSGRETGALLYLHPLGTDLAELAIGRQGYDCFSGGAAECTNGVDPTPEGVPEHFEPLADPPPGWFRLWVPEGLVRTPPPVYVWDLLVEVVQTRLQDGDVPVGGGGATFSLSGVDVGLDAAAIEASLRVELHAQREMLAERLLGSYASNNGQVDVYLERDEEERLWLLSATCALPVPAEGCRLIPESGFWADAALTEPVHTEHGGLRGVPLAEEDVGRVLYVPALEGGAFRLEVEAVGAEGVTLWLRGPR